MSCAFKDKSNSKLYSASDSKLRHSVNHSQTINPPSTSDNKHSQTISPTSKKKKINKNETVEGLAGEMKDTS